MRDTRLLDDALELGPGALGSDHLAELGASVVVVDGVEGAVGSRSLEGQAEGHRGLALPRADFGDCARTVQAARGVIQQGGLVAAEESLDLAHAKQIGLARPADPAGQGERESLETAARCTSAQGILQEGAGCNRSGGQPQFGGHLLGPRLLRPVDPLQPQLAGLTDVGDLRAKSLLGRVLPIPFLEDWRLRADDCLVLGASIAGGRDRAD